MKNLVSIAFTLLLVIGCDKKNNQIKNVINYYNALNNSDYNQIKSTTTDSITITEGEHTLSYSDKTFYEYFKWDSIFRPKYELMALEELNDQLIATVEIKSLRLAFLKNNPLTCQYIISFESDKITKFENLAYLGTDWVIWEERKKSLVSWIKKNHKELDGFIHDLTMDGAIHYRKAIELYENSRDCKLNSI